MRLSWRLQYPLSRGPRQAQTQQLQMGLLTPARTLSLLQGQASSHPPLVPILVIRTITAHLVPASTRPGSLVTT